MADKEARPFILISMILSLFGFWIHPVLGVLGFICIVAVMAFFRDPERSIPDDPLAIVSSADGTVISVEEKEDPHYQNGRMLRIAVFLSVLDVHVNRSPVEGEVLEMHHHAGEFLDARHQEVDIRNEAMNWHLATPNGNVVVRQIAGLIARRIVAWQKVGSPLQKGQRIGMIRFGSRTDIYLPLDCQACVEKGQKVKGGETIIAMWPEPSS
ncbi:MAG: phosphatidylserine decarboxylase [Verrucomicrobiota bacterium]